MSRFAFAAPPLSSAGLFSRIVESSDSRDLETRVNAALAELAVANPAGIVTDITLAGGGDGYLYEVRAAVSSAATPIGLSMLASGTRVFCYQAANAAALRLNEAVAMARLLLAVGDTHFLQDSQIVGASQGTRFMGMLIAGTT